VNHVHKIGVPGVQLPVVIQRREHRQGWVQSCVNTVYCYVWKF
jgi:hypothetical protein